MPVWGEQYNLCVGPGNPNCPGGPYYGGAPVGGRSVTPLLKYGFWCYGCGANNWQACGCGYGAGGWGNVPWRYGPQYWPCWPKLPGTNFYCPGCNVYEWALCQCKRRLRNWYCNTCYAPCPQLCACTTVATRPTRPLIGPGFGGPGCGPCGPGGGAYNPAGLLAANLPLEYGTFGTGYTGAPRYPSFGACGDRRCGPYLKCTPAVACAQSYGLSLTLIKSLGLGGGNVNRYCPIVRAEYVGGGWGFGRYSCGRYCGPGPVAPIAGNILADLCTTCRRDPCWCRRRHHFTQSCFCRRCCFFRQRFVQRWPASWYSDPKCVEVEVDWYNCWDHPVGCDCAPCRRYTKWSSRQKSTTDDSCSGKVSEQEEEQEESVGEGESGSEESQGTQQ